MAWFSPPIEDPTRLVSFSCPKLDVNFGQCLRIGNVIEISGEAGSAKTQLCLDLTLQTLIKNPGNVLYVVTERAFPTKRVKQILDSRQLPSSLLDRIIIKVVWEEDQFLDLLRNQIISSKLQLNMIVIDSLAGPLRSDFENVERIQRALQIHKIGQILHQLSRILNVPIVVTNQVTAVIDQIHETFGRDMVPCFGMNWSNYVHTRLFISKTDLILKSHDNPIPGSSKARKVNVEQRLRKLEVDFSPVLPNFVGHFVIEDSGIKGVDVK